MDLTFLLPVFFMIGYVIRDGFPVLGKTRYARFIGGAVCVLGGALTLNPVLGILLGLAVFLGFYTDQKHGEGARARGWKDYGYLALSGITSVLPLAVTVSVLHYSPWFMLILLTGLLKPIIWKVSYLVVYPPEEPLFLPTRVASACFGVLIGLVVGIVMIVYPNFLIF